MAFNRLVPDRNRAFQYICEKDTGWRFEWHCDIPPGEDADRNAFAIREFCQSFPEVKPDAFDATLPHATLMEALQYKGRSVTHDRYCEDGKVTHLGDLAEDTYRWTFHPLQPKERAQATGLIAEHDSKSRFLKNYIVGCYILECTLTGCEGWTEYRNGAKGTASADTIQGIPEEWVVELGNFIYTLPVLKAEEKKA